MDLNAKLQTDHRLFPIFGERSPEGSGQLQVGTELWSVGPEAVFNNYASDNDSVRATDKYEYRYTDYKY